MDHILLNLGENPAFSQSEYMFTDIGDNEPKFLMNLHKSDVM